MIEDPEDGPLFWKLYAVLITVAAVIFAIGWLLSCKGF